MLQSGNATTIAGMLVRLSFPKGEHQDVIVAPGKTTIGSADDNTIVLRSAEVRPHHATVIVDQRGVVLQVAGVDARTHVNARPVREMALLRIGDVVSLESVNMMLKPDQDEAVRTPIPRGPSGEPHTPPPPSADTDTDGDNDTRYRATPPRAVLRGVSGPYFGKVIPIHGRLAIGRGSDCDLVLDEPEMSRRHAMIEISASEIYLRDLGSANGTYVNGVQVRDAQLYSGDQLAFDINRFLIEAPGLPQRRNDARSDAAEAARQPMVTQTMRAIRADDMPASSEPAPAKGGGWNPWWLIAAGALIALAIAALLLVRLN